MKRQMTDENIASTKMTPLSYSRSIDLPTKQKKKNQCQFQSQHLSSSLDLILPTIEQKIIILSMSRLPYFHLSPPRTMRMSSCMDMYNMRLLLRLTDNLT